MVRLYDVERQAAYTKGSVFLYTLGTWCVLPFCLLALRRAVAVRIVSSARSDLFGLPDLILLVCAEHFDLTRGPS